MEEASLTSCGSASKICTRFGSQVLTPQVRQHRSQCSPGVALSLSSVVHQTLQKSNSSADWAYLPRLEAYRRSCSQRRQHPFPESRFSAVESEDDDLKKLLIPMTVRRGTPLLVPVCGLPSRSLKTSNRMTTPGRVSSSGIPRR